MIPGMIANRVTGLRDAPHQVRVPLCSLAHHEEGRMRPVLFQHIEEANEAVPYRVVVLIAGGLNCDPIDLLAEA